MSGVHAKYSMSNAHRILACPGQVRLAASLPDNETEHSREGTIAHKLLETCIDLGIPEASACLHGPGAIVDWTQKHADAVQHVLDYIALLRAEYPDLMVHSELAVLYPQRLVPIRDVGGTLDVLAFSKSAETAWIIDFKNGAGVSVEAAYNKQLLGYGNCVLRGEAFNVRAFGVIIQPNVWNYIEPRVFEMTWLDLYEFDVDFQKAIVAAEQPDAPRIPGSHCRMCKAAGVCPEREASALAVIGTPVVGFAAPDPATLDLARLGGIVAHTDDVRQWLKDCHALAQTLALSGVHVPGNKLVQAKPRRAYARDKTPKQIAWEIQRESSYTLSDDDVMPRKLVSLTAAEAMLVSAARNLAAPGQEKQAAEAARTAFAFLTPRDTTGALSLVPERDPRPAYTNNALDDFSGVVPFNT